MPLLDLRKHDKSVLDGYRQTVVGGDAVSQRKTIQVCYDLTHLVRGY